MGHWFFVDNILNTDLFISGDFACKKLVIVKKITSLILVSTGFCCVNLRSEFWSMERNRPRRLQIWNRQEILLRESASVVNHVSPCLHSIRQLTETEASSKNERVKTHQAVEERPEMTETIFFINSSLFISKEIIQTSGKNCNDEKNLKINLHIQKRSEKKYKFI